MCMIKLNKDLLSDNIHLIGEIYVSDDLAKEIKKTFCSSHFLT